MAKRTKLATAAAAIGVAAATPAAAQQVRFASIWEQPAENAVLDHWYRSIHSREALRYVGPWLSNYISYRGHDVPDEADRFGTLRYRLTEMWYPSAAARIEAQRAWQPLTPPPTVDRDLFPGKTRINQIWVPVLPDEPWLNTPPIAAPVAPTMLRWVFFQRYPAGVARDEGEAWFTKVHAPELAKAEGVRRFVCYRSVDPARSDRDWLRMCEVWFDSYAAWRAVALTGSARFTAPSWSSQYPFAEYASIFTAPRPDMDFIHDGYRVP
jgi:hypothetical protein